MLAAFLAVRRTWQRRTEIAALFWPDRPETIAKGNLRTLLHRVHQLLPHAEIEFDGDALRWRVASDLDEFDRALATEDWATAIHLGSSDLLCGIEAGATEEFSAWIALERETTFKRWAGAVRAQLLTPHLPLEKRLGLAELWVRRGPFEEEAVRALMLAQLACDRPEAAVAVYRNFAHLLEQSYSVLPTHSLRTLMASLDPTPALGQRALLADSAVEGAQGVSCSPEHALPATRSTAVTGAIGRKLEQLHLHSLLALAGLRIVTVTGMGGVGKTTLCRMLFAALKSKNATRVTWVELAHLASAADFLPAFARSIGAEVGNADPAVEQIRARLGVADHVVFLDNAEHLPELSSSLNALVRVCPNLKCVVSSRHKLGCDDEWLFALDGLPVPDSREQAPEVLLANDSFRLFVGAAERAGASVDIARDASAIVGLIRLVDGLPLAIRLIANLTRLVAVPALLLDLQAALSAGPSASSLTVESVVPELAVSFARSWSALSPRERDGLSALTVFQGSFEREAAVSIANTSTALLQSLLEKSLLRVDDDGRLSLHAAIRSCVVDCSAPPASLQQAHLDYYVLALEARQGREGPARAHHVQDFLQVEWQNLTHAWHSALAAPTYRALTSLAKNFVWHASPFRASSDSRELFEPALEALACRDDLPASLVAFLKAGVGLERTRAGDCAAALRFGEEAMKSAARTNDLDAMLISINVAATALVNLSRLDEAQALLERAASLAAGRGEARHRVVFLRIRGHLAWASGNVAEAIAVCDEEIAHCQSAGDPRGAFRAMINKALSHGVLKATAAALQVIDEARQLVRVAKLGGMYEAIALTERAEIHFCEGDYARTRQDLDSADDLGRQGFFSAHVELFQTIRRVKLCITEGHSDDALLALPRLLESALRGGSPNIIAQCLILLARWYRLERNEPACMALLWAGAQADTVPAFRQGALALMAEGGFASEPARLGESSDPKRTIHEIAATALKRVESLAAERAPANARSR